MSEQHAIPPHARERAHESEPYFDRPMAESPLRRLAALHDEAAETATLANLLGRTPWLTALIGTGAAATFAYVTGLTLQPAPALWVIFALGGALALLRLYRHSVRSPFELLALRAFHGDLKATLLYAGFAWGAGAFFAGPQHNLMILMAFSIGMPVLVELILRAPRAARYFTIPSVLVTAVAVAVGPLGPAAAGLILAAGLAVLIAAEVAEKLLSPRLRPALITVS